MTAVNLKVSTACTYIGRCNLTVTTAKHVVETSTVDCCLNAYSSCSITATEYTAYCVVTTVYEYFCFLGRAGTSVLRSIVSLVTTTKYLLNCIIRICSGGSLIVIS